MSAKEKEANESEHTVVAAILQKPGRMVDVSDLPADSFTDKYAQGAFEVARRYHTQHHGKNAMDIPLMRSKLERADSSKAKKILARVEEYASLDKITDAEFRDALHTLAKARQKRVLQDFGAKALDATLAGDTKAAKQAHRRALLEAEDAEHRDYPVNIRSKTEVERERKRATTKPKKSQRGFDVGFPLLTTRVTFRRESFVILAGYAADGKTHFAKTLAYNAAMKGARTLFVALEMSRDEMECLFVCQHAYTLDPERGGVSFRNALDGTMCKRDKKLYNRALDDFEFKTDTDEGSTVNTAKGAEIYVWSPRRQPTMERYINRASAMHQEQRLDIVVGDYLELIQPTNPTGQYRLDLKTMCDESKFLARDLNLLHIMNHQISRVGRDAAEKRTPKHYLMRDLGESSGVEKAGDIVLWVYSDEEMKHDKEVRVGIAKARKGETLVEGDWVMADYSRGYMAPLVERVGDDEEAEEVGPDGQTQE